MRLLTLMLKNMISAHVTMTTVMKTKLNYQVMNIHDLIHMKIDNT